MLFADTSLRNEVITWAQIFTAIGTVAAAWAAVWIARRAETPRVKLFAGLEYALTIGQGIDEQHKLRLSVVNSGVLPVTITSVQLHLFFSGRRNWGAGLEPKDSTMQQGRFPRRLDHGQEVVVLYTISPTQDPWQKLPWHWWIWRRPTFTVYTTFRKSYRVRPHIRTLRRLKQDIEAFYADGRHG
jgi:hypothetical protein